MIRDVAGIRDPLMVGLTYVLDGCAVVAEPNYDAWMVRLDAIRERGGHVVAHTDVSPGVVVSTVFTGIDYGSVEPKSSDEPVVFETVVFKNGEPGLQQRYASWDKAIQGHAGIMAGLAN
jgi:hypothetical protein